MSAKQTYVGYKANKEKFTISHNSIWW